MIKHVNKSEWKRVRTDDGTEYRHISGNWVVRKINLSGYKSKFFRGIWVGPKRTNPPRLISTDTLLQSQLEVANQIVEDRENRSPRNLAIQAHQDGDTSLALDYVFDYIDQKVNELRDELDERLDRLRISFGE